MTRLIFTPFKFFIIVYELPEFQKYTTQLMETDVGYNFSFGLNVLNISETNHLLSSMKAGKALNYIYPLF
jgi:hypothetical protein